MKKIIYFAATCAALVACNKVNEPQSAPFEKGQKMTLTVSAPEQTKMTSLAESGTGTVNFKWQLNDAIKVTVGSESAIFRANGVTPDGSKANFVGDMPGDGRIFDIQYPAEDPDLTAQSYVSGEALPHDAMKFTAKDVKLDNHQNIQVTAQNAALKIKLYSLGGSVGKIVVKDANSNAYTLNVSPSVKLPKTEAEAKAFYIVVPAGSYTFSVDVYGSATAATPTSTFECQNAQTFTAARILNMPAKEVPTSLLPGEFSVSQTKKVQFTKGNLYWDGSAFHFESSQSACPTTWDANHVGHFFWTSKADFQSGTAAYMPYAETYSYNSRDAKDKIFCDDITVDGQSGLYTLGGCDNGEWWWLFEGRPKCGSLYKLNVTVNGVAGCTVIAPDDYDYSTHPLQAEYGVSSTPMTWAEAETAGLVCLPRAGRRNNSNTISDTNQGYYWTASPENNGSVDWAHYMMFYELWDNPKVYYHTSNKNYRRYGHCIRLVCPVTE